MSVRDDVENFLINAFLGHQPCVEGPASLPYWEFDRHRGLWAFPLGFYDQMTGEFFDQEMDLISREEMVVLAGQNDLPLPQDVAHTETQVPDGNQDFPTQVSYLWQGTTELGDIDGVSIDGEAVQRLETGDFPDQDMAPIEIDLDSDSDFGNEDFLEYDAPEILDADGYDWNILAVSSENLSFKPSDAYYMKPDSIELHADDEETNPSEELRHDYLEPDSIELHADDEETNPSEELQHDYLEPDSIELHADDEEPNPSEELQHNYLEPDSIELHADDEEPNPSEELQHDYLEPDSIELHADDEEPNPSEELQHDYMKPDSIELHANHEEPNPSEELQHDYLEPNLEFYLEVDSDVLNSTSPSAKPVTILDHIAEEQQFLLSHGREHPRTVARRVARALTCEGDETGPPGRTLAEKESSNSWSVLSKPAQRAKAQPEPEYWQPKLPGTIMAALLHQNMKRSMGLTGGAVVTDADTYNDRSAKRRALGEDRDSYKMDHPDIAHTDIPADPVSEGNMRTDGSFAGKASASAYPGIGATALPL